MLLRSFIPSSAKRIISVPKECRRQLSSKPATQKIYKFGQSMGHMKDIDENHTPVLVPFSGHKVAQVSANFMSTFLVTDEGYLFCWGNNEYGQLGLVSQKNFEVKDVTWVYILQHAKITKAVTARAHSVVVTADKFPLAFGSQEFGQLGNGIVEKSIRDMPTKVDSIFPERVTDVACGLDHTVVLTESGRIYSWGYNQEGQLGLGHEDDASFPTEVSGIEKRVVKVVCGFDFTLALTVDGDWYAWGMGEMLQHGNKERDVKLSPVPVKGIPGEKVVDMVAGGTSVMALTESGKLFSWGSGAKGRLGHGNEDDLPRPKHIEAFQGRKVVKFSTGGGQTLAVTDDGKIYSWGFGNGGRLGHGDEVDVFLPKEIQFFKDKKVDLVACGLNHSVVITQE